MVTEAKLSLRKVTEQSQLKVSNELIYIFKGFPGGTVVKNPPANAGDARDLGLIPESGRSPGEGHGKPLRYSCLENPLDIGAWKAMVHGVTQSRIRLKQLSTHTLIKQDNLISRF